MKKEKSIILLEGIHCAGCADKIQTTVSKLPGVDQCTVDMVGQRMNVVTSETVSKEQVIEEAIKIAKMVEPHITPKLLEENHGHHHHEHDHDHDHHHHHDGDHKKMLFTLLARIGVAGVLFFIGEKLSMPYPMQLSIILIAYLIVGYEVVGAALRNIGRGQIFDENFLMTVATLGAFAIGAHEEALGVMVFYLIGETIQGLAVQNSRGSIQALLNIRPETARVEIENDWVILDPKEVKINATILVKAGEKIPLDGVVLEGSASVDTSALTGESLPQYMEAGSNALSGMVCIDGVLKIKVEKRYEDSTVAKILHLVEEAAYQKAPTEKFITKFARYYTPVVVIVAAILALVPPFITGDSFSTWIYRALVFLVVSCPCALVISIPLAYFGGIGGASRKGILVKGGNYLEALKDVTTVVFDKTGTLTKGSFEVQQVWSTTGFNESKVLQIASALESYSNHPIAKAIVRAYGEGEVMVLSDIQEVAGKGISAKDSKGNTWSIGNHVLMSESGIKVPGDRYVGTMVYLARNEEWIGTIGLQDEIKKDSISAIKELTKMGVKHTVMLTGDQKSIAKDVASTIGIQEYHGELLPHEKLEKLEEVFAKYGKEGKVAFVGDGINDAPVLARADVGIAMGGIGSDAAIEACDVVLMTDEMAKLPEAIDQARKTQKIVMQNIVFALGVKAIVLVLGAMGFASMWAGVFADVGVALLAVLNSVRAMKK